MSAFLPAIILVNPQMGENIGAAARAMLNFGLTDLRLVTPRDGWPNQRAVDMSSGALDMMPPVQIFETLVGALADRHYVYGTTARTRDMNKPVSEIRDAAVQFFARARNKQNIGFVFGPERTGLSNEGLALCHEIITVPTNPDFSSINLAQSVLLVAYEWFRVQGHEVNIGNKEAFAPHEKLEELFVRLEEELERGRFFRADDLRPTMMRNIRTMFMRAQFSEQEVSTFHGIISALIGNKTRKIKQTGGLVRR